MEQLNDKLNEIQFLLSELSDVRVSIAESVGEDPDNVDGIINALLNTQIYGSNTNNSNNTNHRNNRRLPNYNDSRDHIYSDHYNNPKINITTPTLSPSEREISDAESLDGLLEDPPEYRSPHYRTNDTKISHYHNSYDYNNNSNNNNNHSNSNNRSNTNNSNNNNTISNNIINPDNQSHTNAENDWHNKSFSSSNNKPSSGRSSSNAHYGYVSLASTPTNRFNSDIDYTVSEPTNADPNPTSHSYNIVSDEDSSEHVDDKGDKNPTETTDNSTDAICCIFYQGCGVQCLLRVCGCLWFLVCSLLFVLDVYSDLCLAIHYTNRYHHVWASLTFILFFLPWMYNVYSFFKFQRYERCTWEKWGGCLSLLLGLYPVFRSIVALLDKLYQRQHNNRKRRNPSDPKNNATSAAEIFMMTVLLQDIPQIFLQFFIAGRRNAIEAPVTFSLITSFLCIAITVSSGFAAITQGQYGWMSDNVEMFLLQPCQEKILQSRILKDEWKDFYQSSPGFNPLLREVEKSKKKLKTKMAVVTATIKPLSLLHRWKYYTSTFPLYVFMTASFVPSLSLFASLEETKAPWMAMMVYFMVHLYVMWSLLCCRGAIYFPIHKLQQPLINYTGYKCSCRTSAMRFSFVLQLMFFIFVNAFVSLWCTSVAPFVAQKTNSSTVQCLPSYIWPNTLAILKTFQVTLTNNTNSAEWFRCQANYASTKRNPNIMATVIDWILTFRICMSDQVTIVYWIVTVSSVLLLIYHFLLVCQPRVEIQLDQQTQLWRGIFDERKNLWDKIEEEQKTMKAWDPVKSSTAIQSNEVWNTTVNRCVYSKWKKRPTSL